MYIVCMWCRTCYVDALYEVLHVLITLVLILIEVSPSTGPDRCLP